MNPSNNNNNTSVIQRNVGKKKAQNTKVQNSKEKKPAEVCIL